MNVLLDMKPIEVVDESLAGALSAAVELAEQQGRTIIEVVLDGQPLVGEQLENVSTSPIPDSNIAFVSADPVQLVQQSLFDAAEALASTRHSHTEIAEQLQGGEDAPKALTQLGETLAVWQGVQDVLARGYGLLNRDPNSLVIPEDIAAGKTLPTLVAELSEQLREVRRSLEDHDLASLADAVGYELEPMAEQWSRVLAFSAEALTQS